MTKEQAYAIIAQLITQRVQMTIVEMPAVQQALTMLKPANGTDKEGGENVL